MDATSNSGRAGFACPNMTAQVRMPKLNERSALITFPYEFSDEKGPPILSPAHPPAIHRQNCAAHVVRRSRCEEHHCPAQVLGTTPPPRRNARKDRRIAHRIGAQRGRV